MALPQKLFAPAFAENRTRWQFLLLVGVMVYIATFALGVEGLISAFTLTWDHGMDRRLTIEVPAVEDEGAMTQADRVKQIVAALQAMPDVAKVEVLPEEDSQKLLQPWISQPELLKSLPMPSLIDIDRQAGATFTAHDIRDRLKPVITTLQVDDHAGWLANLVRLVDGVMVIAGVVIALTGVAVVFAVSLLCRVVVATEHETIVLLHVLGADDDDIAQHFQHHTGWLSAPAVLGGFVIGVASAALVLFLLHNIADASFIAWKHWAILGGLSLLIPAATIGIAALSARVTVTYLLMSEKTA